MTPLRSFFIAAALLIAGAGVGIAVGGGRAETVLKTSAVFQWGELSSRPTAVGSVRHVLRTPTATLDELESHVTTLHGGQSPHPPHQHANEELIILKEGTVEAWVNGEWVAVEPGGIIFFGSNVPHTVRNVSDRPATYYVVNWSPPGLKARGETGGAP